MKKTPVPRDSRSETRVPKGFAPDREKSWRACFRCTYIIDNFGDGPRRCTFRCRRSDFEKGNRHQHKFDLPFQNDDGFPSDYFERHKRAELAEILSLILNQVAELSGELDISVTKSSSESMKKFIENILTLGIRIGIADPSINLQDGFIQLSQTKINDSLKHMSDEREQELQEKYSRNIKFVNILMDTGTINKFTVLHFILMNPNFSEDVWPFDNFENRNFESDQYLFVIDEIVNHLLEQGIEPVAIIADQQAAQVKGICDYLINANSKLAKSLIHIPCIAHVTNLIYVEILTMDEFKLFLDEIDELISFCRIEEIAMQLGRYCPTLVKTRWFYLSEVLNFFELFEEDAVIHIQKLISTHERYADFIEFRNSIIDDPDFINYD